MLVVDNFVIVQVYLVNGMCIVKLIVFKVVWMVQVGLVFFFNENVVFEFVDLFYQCGLLVDFGVGKNNQYGLIFWFVGGVELFYEVCC